MRLLFPTKALVDEDKLLTKKFHGSNPTVKNIIKGTLLMGP